MFIQFSTLDLFKISLEAGIIKFIGRHFQAIPAISLHKIRRTGRLFQLFPYYYYSYTYIYIYYKHTYFNRIFLIFKAVDIIISL